MEKRWRAQERFLLLQRTSVCFPTPMLGHSQLHFGAFEHPWKFHNQVLGEIIVPGMHFFLWVSLDSNLKVVGDPRSIWIIARASSVLSVTATVPVDESSHRAPPHGTVHFYLWKLATREEAFWLVPTWFLHARWPKCAASSAAMPCLSMSLWWAIRSNGNSLYCLGDGFPGHPWLTTERELSHTWRCHFLWKPAVSEAAIIPV